MVDVDPDRGVERFCNAASRLIEIVERRLQGEWIEAEICERLGTMTAPLLTIGGVTLFGDLTRQNDGADDPRIAVANRRGLHVDDAIFVRSLIVNDVFGAARLALQRTFNHRGVVHLLEKRRTFAHGSGIHAFQTAICVVNRRRFGNLIEDRSGFRDLENRPLVQQCVVQREGGVAADLGKKRDLLFSPFAALGALVDRKAPRLIVLRSQDLQQRRTDLMGLRQLDVRIGIVLKNRDRPR